MATIRVKMRKSSRDANKGTLYYQVIHHRCTRMIHSGCSLELSEWDGVREIILMPEGAGEQRKEYLCKVEKVLEKGLSRLKNIVKRLERLPDAYTVKDVAREFRSANDTSGFIAFGRRLVEQLRKLDKQQKAERYTYTLNSFCRFRNNRDLPMENLDGSVMVAYENYLRDNDLCINTTSFYMRNLRAMYNEAVEKGLVEDCNPFKYVYTGIDKTVKRAVSLETLRRIRRLDLTLHPQLDFVRDLFLFSVYTRGMSFVDMAYLRKKDVYGGVLIYHRQKTNHLLKVKWEAAMQGIVDKYDTGDSPYLLPIIKKTAHDPRRQYRSALRLMNKKLKEIGDMVGLVKPLTTYVARHAWASIAKERHVPISVISEAMGHNSEHTTRIYLAALDTAEIDNANRDIMNALEKEI